MNNTTRLCTLPPSSEDTCCGQTAQVAQVPGVIDNPPGLSAIQYRIGTFTSFRQAMLDVVAASDLMLTAVTTELAAATDAFSTSIQVEDYTRFPSAVPFRIKIGTEYLQVIAGAGSTVWTVQRGVDQSTPQPHALQDSIFSDPANPFSSWQEGSDGDYQTMFVELWAYLADVFTFYQERIANEAYLGTATQRDSLLRLAELIDNRPSPGAGASTVLAFSAQKGKTVTVPASFAVASKASATAPAAVFETSSAVTVIADHNAMPAATLLPRNQFAWFSATKTARNVVLQGTTNHLSVGDYVVLVSNEATSGEHAWAFRLQAVQIDKPSNTTKITWTEPAGSSYGTNSIMTLYALRVSASVFGCNAPEYDTLPSQFKTQSDSPASKISTVAAKSPVTSAVTTGSSIATTDTTNIIITALLIAFPNDWDDKNDPSYYLPASHTVFLDAVYAAIKATPSSPGWIVLLADSPGPDMVTRSLGSSPSSIIFHVTDASAASKTGYTLNSKVTRLTLGSGENVAGKTFPIRTTTVLAGSQPLFPQDKLPVTDPVAGTSVTLNGLYPQLQAGQKVVVQGKLSGDSSGAVAAEMRVLDGPPELAASSGTTTINFTNALTNAYDPASTVVFGNVVEATQGETVRNEILGSGNGAAFQTFVLKKKPLTYLPATDSEGLAAVKDTLLVTVNGVEWEEQPSLVNAAPNAHVYIATTDDSGQTTVSFGDGFNGAPPPSGRDNIQSSYRKGLGTSGNLAAGAIQQLKGNAPGLQTVTNPQPASGGADPDSVADIRVNAPASMTTFGRAISARDYAAIALQFPGIQKATAVWIRVDENLQPVLQPYVQLTVATADEIPIQGSVTAKNLRSYLDNHRDPNVPLKILDFTPLYIDVALTIDVQPLYGRQATLAKVVAALNPATNPDGSAGYFSFANSQFGGNIHLSAVYAVVQAIEGVQDVLITTLRRMDQDANTPSTVRNDIFVRPTELAVIGNDPNVPAHGFLTVQLGKGGFVDA